MREERPVISDVDSPAFEATRSWKPTAPAHEHADPRPTSAPQGAGARRRKKAKRKKAQKAKKAAARQAAKEAQAKPTE